MSDFRSVPVIVLFPLAIGIAGNAKADPRGFICQNGSVQTAGCWYGGAKPTANVDDALFGYSYYSNSNVTASLSSGSLVSGNQIVARDRNAVVNQSGGSNSVGRSLYVGHSASGTYNLSGGTLYATDNAYVGLWSTGVFTHSAGTFTGQAGITGVFLGGSGGNGTYNLSSTASINVYAQYIGNGGSGTFNQTGGGNTVSTLDLGYYGLYSNGVYNMQAGNLSVGVRETVGRAGTGVFNQTGGSHAAAALFIGGDQSFSGTGSYNLSGVASLNIGGWERLGNRGTGTFTQTGGTHSANQLVIGSQSTGNGSYHLRGGTFAVANSIGNGAGSSTLNIDGGTLSVGGGNGSIDVDNLNLGSTAGYTGSHTLSGTGTITAANETIGNGGTGTLTQTGGTHTVTGTLALGQNAGSSGTYRLQGGVLKANHIDTVNAGSATFQFTGGELAVDHFTGHLVNAGGALSPGNSPGITNITGDYTQTAAGLFNLEIGGLLPGSEYDQLHIFGTAYLDGTLNVSLFDFGSGAFAPQVGDSFDILTADVVQGGFSSLSLAALAEPNLFWQIDYLADAIGTTDVVRLSVVSAVPVPAAAWLFASGFAGLVGVARRHQLRLKYRECRLINFADAAVDPRS